MLNCLGKPSIVPLIIPNEEASYDCVSYTSHVAQTHCEAELLSPIVSRIEIDILAFCFALVVEIYLIGVHK
jgi:hypothetical protein